MRKETKNLPTVLTLGALLPSVLPTLGAAGYYESPVGGTETFRLKEAGEACCVLMKKSRKEAEK